jgi:translocation and assembly module TamB
LELGTIDFDKKLFKVEAFVNNVNIVKFAGLEFRDNNVALMSTGDMDLQGHLNDNVKLKGSIQLSSVALKVNQFKVKNTMPVLLRVSNSQFDLDQTRFKGENTVFDLAGLATFKKMRLFINGITNLKIANQFTDRIKNIKGKLAFNVLVQGPFGDPRMRGEATIKNGQMKISGFPDIINKINGKINLGAKTIRFSDFTGRTSGGTLGLKGWIGFNNAKINDYRFEMNLSNLDLQLIHGLSFRASTIKDGLIFFPDKKRKLPGIKGDIEISDFRYTEDVRIIEISSLSVQNLSRKQRRMRRPKLFDKSRDLFFYDINLHGRKNLKIKNNILDAAWRIDDKEEPLRLVGTNQSFGFLGRILGTKGQVHFAGKTFDLNSASVTFKDLLRPWNPEFRISADVEVRDWRVSITAQGEVDEYKVTLSSQPYLSYEDLLFLLLTGMTKAEHSMAGSQGLSGSLAPILGNMSSGIIPVEVNIYSEYSEAAGEDVTRVALGKRIAEDIWLEVSSSLGQSQEIAGTMDYRINDNFSVSANYDNNKEISTSGNWGMDLKFRLEF